MNQNLANLDSCPALVLNADYRPLSYYPLSLWSWQESIKAVFLQRVNIVSQYERTIKSPSFEMFVPSVVALKDYIYPQQKPAFTRFNVFLRDHFTCQYCNKNCNKSGQNDLTFDHLIPRSLGGKTVWDNIVTACSACNLKKGGKMPKQANMQPKNKPYVPTIHDLHNAGRKFPPNYLHDSWMDYLYWDTPLEP